MVSEGDESLRRNRSRSWWQQRTSMERRSIVLLVIAGLLILGLIIGLAVVAHNSKNKISKPTAAHIQAASDLLQFMDQSVDPCDDFYQFTCGRFLEEAEIPDERGEVSLLGMVNDLVQKQLKAIMEDPIQPDAPKPFNLVKIMYSVCMNTTAIDADDIIPIQRFLRDVGGWPVVDAGSWREDLFDWKKLLYKLREVGLDANPFFEFDVAVDFKNTSRRIIGLDQAKLDITRKNLLGGFNDPVVSAYYNYMVDLSVLFGANRQVAEREMKEMMEFRIQLGNISVPEEERRDYTNLYNLLSISDLQGTYSSIPWLELFNGLLAHPTKHLGPEDKVIVSHPQQLHYLEKLFLQTSGRTLANYVLSKTVRSLQWALPKRIRDREQQFLALVLGVSGQDSRRSECAYMVSDALPLAAGALYARRYSSEELRQSAKKVVKDIKNEIVNMIKTVTWMDEETRKEAVLKASTMTTHVAYADEFLDDSKLDEYYEGLTFNSENYFQLRNKIVKFKTDKKYLDLWNPVNKTDWSTRIPPTTVNAGYAPNENSIQIPAGILQEKIFSKDKPFYMNYAAIGYIIGHEFTHGFDDTGKQFDKDGNLINWWNKKTDDAFTQKAKCIVDQYAKYTVPDIEINLNGQTTQGENIADCGGIKEAYQAYNAWVKRHGAEQPLPGLNNYTAKQTFWIAAANVWCIKERKEVLKLNILTDEHSPRRYRVTVPFINSKYFATDFNCPVGSKMNPKHKCEVW